MKLFDIDGPILGSLGKVVDFLILNILYIICCIPIVTIGAANTALYYTAIKQVHHEGYIAKNFIKAFKANFKQATILWIPALLFFGLLIANTQILPMQPLDSMRQGIYVLSIILLIMGSFFFTLVYPLLARFENTITAILTNAFIISVRSIPWTLFAYILCYLPVIILLFSTQMGIYILLFWAFLGFSVSAYLMAYIYENFVFSRYISDESENIED